MANPRTTSDLWDDGEDEIELHYPHATPRRAVLAHTLGIVGVLGTLALAAFAFAPRMPTITSKLQGLFSKEEPARNPAKPVVQLLAPTPPAPSVETAAPLPAAPAVTAETAPTPAPVVTPSTPPPELVAAPTIPSPEPVVAPSTPSPAPVVAPSAPSPVAEPAIESSRPAARTLAPSGVRNASRTEPRLTAREIERRKQRYEAWLKQEGLEPVH